MRPLPAALRRRSFPAAARTPIAVHVGVMSHPLAAVLTRLQFPHIVLGAPDFDSQVCWIDNSNTYSGTVAASFLLSRGYKRLAFIGGKSYDLGSALRLQGVKQGCPTPGQSWKTNTSGSGNPPGRMASAWWKIF